MTTRTSSNRYPIALCLLVSLAGCGEEAAVTPGSTMPSSTPADTENGGGGPSAGGSSMGTAGEGGALSGGAGGTAGTGGALETGGAAGSGGGGGTASGGTASGGMASGGTGGGGDGGAASGGAAGGSGGAPPACDPSPGEALKFSGDVIDFMTGTLGTDLPGLNAPRTVEVWAKFLSKKSFTAERSLLELGSKEGGKEGPADQLWGIDLSGYDDEAIGAYFGPYTNGYSDNNGKSGPFLKGPPEAGWVHLAWAYEGDNGELQFTINGDKTRLMVGPGEPNLIFKAGIVTLGSSQYYGDPMGWDGVMDELRIWKTFRTPPEIRANMDVLMKGTEEGLVAYYQMNEGEGDFTDSASGNMAHRLTPCPAMSDKCLSVNAANPEWVDSDIPNEFTCAE